MQEFTVDRTDGRYLNHDPFTLVELLAEQAPLTELCRPDVEYEIDVPREDFSGLMAEIRAGGHRPPRMESDGARLTWTHDWPGIGSVRLRVVEGQTYKLRVPEHKVVEFEHEHFHAGPCGKVAPAGKVIRVDKDTAEKLIAMGVLKRDPGWSIIPEPVEYLRARDPESS